MMMNVNDIISLISIEHFKELLCKIINMNMFLNIQNVKSV